MNLKFTLDNFDDILKYTFESNDRDLSFYFKQDGYTNHYITYYITKNPGVAHTWTVSKKEILNTINKYYHIAGLNPLHNSLDKNFFLNYTIRQIEERAKLRKQAHANS